MLRMRREQMRAFEDYMRAQFEKRMFAHLRAAFPARLADTPDDQLRQLIHEGVERALAFGIEIEDDVRRFLEAAVVLGPGLDSNEWAGNILHDQSLDGTEKMDRLESHEAYQRARRQEPTS